MWAPTFNSLLKYVLWSSVKNILILKICAPIHKYKWGESSGRIMSESLSESWVEFSINSYYLYSSFTALHCQTLDMRSACNWVLITKHAFWPLNIQNENPHSLHSSLVCRRHLTIMKQIHKIQVIGRLDSKIGQNLHLNTETIPFEPERSQWSLKNATMFTSNRYKRIPQLSISETEIC